MTYIQQIRSQIGHNLLIHPAMRILILNPQNEVLMIRKKDSLQWNLPAGSFERNETIVDCVKREVKEETGLSIEQVQLIGISTAPDREQVVYPNRDRIQYFTTEWFTRNWSGTLQPLDSVEVIETKFQPWRLLKQLPANEAHIVESWEHFQMNQQPLID